MRVAVAISPSATRPADAQIDPVCHRRCPVHASGTNERGRGSEGLAIGFAGLAGVLEQPGPLACQVGDHGDAVLVDQVEPRERAPQALAMLW